jgi:hypothetical protein
MPVFLSNLTVKLMNTSVKVMDGINKISMLTTVYQIFSSSYYSAGSVARMA